MAPGMAPRAGNLITRLRKRTDHRVFQPAPTQQVGVHERRVQPVARAIHAHRTAAGVRSDPRGAARQAEFSAPRRRPRHRPRDWQDGEVRCSSAGDAVRIREPSADDGLAWRREDYGSRRATTPYNGSADGPGLRSYAWGRPNRPDNRKYAPISSAWSASFSACHTATALVGNIRFEYVTASGASGFNTRPTSANTSAGRVRYWIETVTTAPSNEASSNGSEGSRLRS